MSLQDRLRHLITWPNVFLALLIVICSSLVISYPFLGIALVVAILLWLIFSANAGYDARIRDLRQEIYAHQATGFDSESHDAEKIRAIADAAMHRARHDPSSNHLRVDDIGLLVYEDSPHPKISRLSEIPTNASHIRPFMVLDQPAAHSITGNGVIGFSLIDEQGNLRFSSRSRYQIEPGQNFLTPPTWLPLTDQDPDGTWSIAVSLGNNRLLAVHNFAWLAVGGEVRARFTGDGEISAKLRRLMDSPSATLQESVSLDDLLVEQVEEAPLEVHVEH